MKSKRQYSHLPINMLDGLLWAGYLIYLSGGFVIQGKYYFGFFHDILITLCTLVGLAIVFNFESSQSNFIKAFTEINDSFIQRRWPKGLGSKFILLSFIYVLLMFVLAPLIRHWSFGTRFLDFGIIEQLVWRNSNGLGPTSTLVSPDINPINFIHHNHLSLWQYPLGLIYRLIPYPEFLLFLQSIALLVPMIPIWNITRKILPEDKFPTILMPLMYWGLESVHRLNIYDVYENSFIVFFALGAFDAFLEKKWLKTTLFTLAICLFKEDAFVVAGGMGLYFLWKQNHKLWAVGSALLGFGVFLGYSVSCQSVIGIGGRYAYLGNSFSEAKTTILHHPMVFFVQLLSVDNLIFYARLLRNAAGLWIFGGLSIIPILPTFFELSLSTSAAMKFIYPHYVMALMGQLIFAAIQRLNYFRQRLTNDSFRLLYKLAFLISVSQIVTTEPSYIFQQVRSSALQDRLCYTELISHIPKSVPVITDDPT